MAWAALEDLALGAHPDKRLGRPVGVRDVAGGIGVTKDTAARAVSALADAGLVAWTRVDGPTDDAESGYRLHLPEGVLLQTCPNNPDSTARGTTARTGGTIETALGVQSIRTSQHLPMAMAPPIRPNELAVDAVDLARLQARRTSPSSTADTLRQRGRFIHASPIPDQLQARRTSHVDSLRSNRESARGPASMNDWQDDVGSRRGAPMGGLITIRATANARAPRRLSSSASPNGPGEWASRPSPVIKRPGSVISPAASSSGGSTV